MSEVLTKGLSDDQLMAASHLSRPEMAHLIGLLDKKDFGLEIGCWKGETTVWLLKQGIDEMTVIDTFNGSPELSEAHDIRRAFSDNTAAHRNSIWVREGKSFRNLIQLLSNHYDGDQPAFDFIYVDGSHHSRDVIGDAIMAFALLRPGGLMIFDDYKWRAPNDFTGPRPAIDFFLKAFDGELEVVSRSYQLAIRKR